MEIQSSEMIEGSLGKISSGNKEEKKRTAKGEKKSMKSDDYPEDSKVYSDKDQAHAMLEVDGAEIEQPDNENSQGKGQNMFASTTNSRDNLDEFEISPRLEVTSDLTSNGVLNEAGIEKAVEEALKQRNDKGEKHNNEAAFIASDKHDSDREPEGHETEVINHENKEIEQDPTLGRNGNGTVLEMSKIASEAGQVAMNLVNVSNFKVVIPGGKTYEISGVPGKKPVVTVVPDNEKDKVGQAVENASETSTARMNTMQADELKNRKGSKLDSELPDGKTVTAIQNGNKIDVHVDKKTDNLAMQGPQVMPTLMDHPYAAVENPIMPAKSPVQPYPILDSSVAALMYHPDHVTMEHPPTNENTYHHEHNIEDMHIEVNSTLPQHEAPKPQKLDPEVIKVEFLPEGISVDTASSKLTKKCGHEPSKRTEQSSECNDDSKDDKQEEAEKAKTKTISDQSSTKLSNMMARKEVTAQETKMFVAPTMSKGVPGDVTVVPAERQEPLTRVLVQDIAGEKNESRVNFVKASPMSKLTDPFPVSE